MGSINLELQRRRRFRQIIEGQPLDGRQAVADDALQITVHCHEVLHRAVDLLVPRPPVLVEQPLFAFQIRAHLDHRLDGATNTLKELVPGQVGIDQILLGIRTLCSTTRAGRVVLAASLGDALTVLLGGAS